MASHRGHALTLVGHLLPGGDGKDQAESNVLNFGERNLPQVLHYKHHVLGEAVQLYYAHDDNYGPFHRVRLVSDKDAEATRKKARDERSSVSLNVTGEEPRDDAFLDQTAGASWLVETGREEICQGVGKALIVPLPRYVQGRPETALTDAISQIEMHSDSDWLPKGDALLWRCLLVDTSEFKMSLKGRGYSSELRAHYAVLHLPKFAWLVEFSVFAASDWSIVRAKRIVHGEYLYDASTPTTEPSCVLERIGHRVRDATTTGGDFQEIGKSSAGPKCFVFDGVERCKNTPQE